MALSRIWSAFIILAIITASVKTFFSVNDKAVFTSMVTGKSGDTISGIVQKLGANSDYNILYDNDLLKGNPKALQPGMIIAYSLRPSGN